MYYFKLLFILLFSVSVLQAENQKLQPVSVQLEWKHQFEFAGFYAALEQGYYKDVNLAVEIKEYHAGIDTVSDVLKGISTYGMSSSHLILERLAGKKIVHLASYLKQNALVLITKPDIQTIEDLKNKKIMAASDELQGTSLAAMLHEHHLTTNDIEIIPHSFNIDAFVHGDIDAMTAFLSNQPFLLDQKQIPYRIFNPVNDGIYSYDVELFTSEYQAKLYPLRTQNFIDATRKGWEYALSHKEEIIELIYQKYSKEKSKESLLYEANTLEKLMKINLFKIGAVVPELTQLNTNMYVQLGMVNKHWDLEGYTFDPKPIQLNLTTEELAFVKAHPVIRFSDVQWEPFASIEGEKYSGVFKEYYALLEQRTGIQFDFVKIGDGINFQLVLDALKRKEIDMIDGSGKTEERKNYALFAGPLMQVSLAIVSNKENRFISLESLKGKRISVAKGSTASEYISAHFPEIQLVYTNSIDESLSLLMDEKADAVVDNLVVLDYMIKNKSYFQSVEISGISDYKFDLYALIRDDYALLHSIIQKAVQSISQEELFSINNKLLQSIVKPSKTQRDVDFRNVVLTQEEKHYLKEKGSVNMCIDPNWMPLDGIQDGKHIGVSAEYIQLLAKKVKTPIILLPTTTWSESISFIKEKKCDILSLAMETDTRKKFMDFTIPFLTLPLVIATTQDKIFISNLEVLNGKSIGIGKNYASAEFLKRTYPLIHFIEIDTIKDGLKDVINGTLFGYIDNLTSIGYHIQKYFPTELKIAGQFNEALKLGIGVHKDEAPLVKILDKAIVTIDTRTKERILNKWISVKYDRSYDYVLFLKIVTPFLFLALLLLIRQDFLRKYNKKLKHQVAQKVDELRQKDEILLKKYRMAAMGEMISMIAHQWRQPLAAISSSILGIGFKLKSGKFNFDEKSDREKFLLYLENKHHNISEYVQYLSTTTDDFRNFFNPDKCKDTVSLTLAIENALNIVQEEMQNKGINIVKEYHADNTLSLYQNEVMQVILNILQNSEDHLLAHNISDPKISISTREENNSLIISLCDNGKGISPDIIDEIFNPYFTTKDEKNGAGLGLYMSKIMIEEHHQGQFNVINSEHGVCFEIIFKEEIIL